MTMFDWFRRVGDQVPQHPSEAALVFQPEGTDLLSTHEEVERCLQKPRTIVYVTVEWSGQERQSRVVFAETIRRINEQFPDLGISIYVLSEYTEGNMEWLPNSAATGYGAIVWLDNGRVIDHASYAAAVGVDELVNRTVAHWRLA
jgi:hypothetical protein